MADLTSCYFCDAIDEPLEEQPLIPESLDPPEDRQRTVAVCPTCGRKLDRAMEPLLSWVSDRARSSEGNGEPTEKSSEPTGRESRSTDSGSDPSEDRDDDAAVSLADDARRDATPSEETEPDTNGNVSPEESVEATDGPAVEESDAEATLPDAARDVIRLLRNREFPVDRSEIETVARSAYELGPEESSEAIDALIERGILAENQGQLERPD